MDRDEYNRLRKEAAAELKIELFHHYSEQEAATFLPVGYKDLQEKRAAGFVPYVQYGERKNMYCGYHIVDMVLLGFEAALRKNELLKEMTFQQAEAAIAQAKLERARAEMELAEITNAKVQA